MDVTFLILSVELTTFMAINVHQSQGFKSRSGGVFHHSKCQDGALSQATRWDGHLDRMELPPSQSSGHSNPIPSHKKTRMVHGI